MATNSPNLIKFITRMEEEASKIDLKAKLLSQKQALEQLSKGKKQKNIPCEKILFLKYSYRYYNMAEPTHGSLAKLPSEKYYV